MSEHTVDLLEELRLRRWARMNYTSPEKRHQFHPVIRAEMAIMDLEAGTCSPARLEVETRNRAGADALPRFVPLADTPSVLRFDTAHPTLRGPAAMRNADIPAAEVRVVEP